MRRLSLRLSCCGIVFGLCGFAPGCTDHSQRAGGAGNTRIDPNDPSIVFDEPFEMNTGFKAHNGKAYEKAALCIEGNAKLVLPDEGTVVNRHNQESVVLIFMEKRMNWHGHFRESVSIKEERQKMGCAVKLDNGALLIGSFGEFSGLETANTMHFLVLASAQVEVVRRAGLVGGHSLGVRSPNLINAKPEDPRLPLTMKSDRTPECWLPPTAEDGWHEIPTGADPERRAAAHK